MAWTDRLREPAYTSPSGKRIVFTYEDVRKQFDKKTASFNFPDADGTYIQDLGKTGRRYPLRVIFWGADYDIQADEFEAAISERGTGKLEHPIYGAVDVVPFGTFTRRDDLKTAANQAIIELTFWETIGLVYPTGQADPGRAVLTAVDEYNTVAAESFAGNVVTKTAIERITLANEITAATEAVVSVLDPIAAVQNDVQQEFKNISDSVLQSVDQLIGRPITLGLQTVQMIQSPARAIGSIVARLTSYANLLGITTSKVQIPSIDARNSNAFRAADLFASTQVTGSVLSVVNNQFETKKEAVEAADTVLGQMDILNIWRENNFESLSLVDTGESYQQLQEAVALAAGFLVEISFSLKQEKSVVLDRARTIIDLSAELYGDIDAQLDFLISSNNLSGDEILELPRGREIVYYV